MEKKDLILNEGQKNFNIWISFFMSIITIGTFAIAYSTLPISGPLCTESCISYPYNDIISRFPRDYLWIYSAILLIIIYMIFSSCINFNTTKEKRIFSNIGLAFAVISSTIFLIDFFIQISVIQPSIINDEMESIPILTQYNPHGIFIVLEELGYLMMSISFLFFGISFENIGIGKWIRGIFLSGFTLTLLSLVIISIVYGINREYIFEIAAISINWLVLMLNGILIGYFYKSN